MKINGEITKKELINNASSIITISKSDDENTNNISDNHNNTALNTINYNSNKINILKILKNKNEKFISFRNNFSSGINNGVDLPESSPLFLKEPNNSKISNIFKRNKNISDMQDNIGNYEQSLLKYLSYQSQIIENLKKSNY